MRRELAQRIDHRAVLIFRADGDAQGLRQAVAADGADDDALGVQIVVGGDGAVGVLEHHQHEVARAGQNIKAEAAQCLGQARLPVGYQIARSRLVRGIGQGGGRRLQTGHGHVERQTDAVDGLGHRQRRIAEADAQPPQTVDLGEGAGDDHVRGRLGQREGRLPVGLGHIFGIGLIDDQNDVRRQGGVQAADLLARVVAAGRVRRVGDIDDLGAVIDLRQQGVDLGLVVRFGRQLDLGLTAQGADPIGQKAVLAAYDIVARRQIGLVQQGEDLVRAIAEDQALGLQSVQFRDGGAQLGRPAVGIDVDVLDGGLIGGARLFTRTQHVLVRGQLHRLGDPSDGRLAPHIGRDVEDAGLRYGAFGCGRVGHEMP